MLSAICFNLDQSNILLSGKELTLSQTSPCPCLQYRSLKKKKNTVGKGEIAHNKQFSDSVFYPFGELSAFFIRLEIVICKFSQFGRVQNLSCGN